MRSSILIAACVTVTACAMAKPAREPAATTPAPAPVELYVTKHSEIELEAGSPAWNELSAQERTAHEEEGGVFRDVQDYLLLQPRAGGTLAFCVLHYGRFLHECQIAGVATRAADGSFIYRSMATNYDDRAVECGVVLKRDKDQITFDELVDTATPGVPHDCRMQCGAHASLRDGIAFALADRHHDAAEITLAQNDNGGCPLPQ
jgi:hypothetical protein